MALKDEHDASRKLLDGARSRADDALRVAVREALEAQLDTLDGPDPKARAARVARAIGDALAGAVARERGETRTESRDALNREFNEAGGNAAKLPDIAGGPEDAARGDAVGATFAEAWLADFNGAVGPDVDVREAARRTLDLTIQERIGRIAVTEAGHAFSSERNEVMAAYARQLRARGQAIPTKVWVCRLGGDCVVCFALCGTVKPFDEPWTIGTPPVQEVYIPGAVHPNCSCSIHIADVPEVGPSTRPPVVWPADINQR